MINAEATLNNNSKISTSDGLLQWRKIELSTKGAILSNGKLSIPENDFREFTDDKVTVNATVNGNSAVSASLDIQLDYSGKFSAYFRGQSGRAGQDGSTGRDGESGKPGADTRPGGDGGHGQRGNDGGMGNDGGYGENLEVYIGLDKNKSNGGDGGNGVSGGNGGMGGDVTIYVQPAAKKYMSCINVDNLGGAGGTQGSTGSGGSCPSNCKGGTSGKFGDVGKSGAPGKLTIIDKDVKFDW